MPTIKRRLQVPAAPCATLRATGDWLGLTEAAPRAAGASACNSSLPGAHFLAGAFSALGGMVARCGRQGGARRSEKLGGGAAGERERRARGAAQHASAGNNGGLFHTIHPSQKVLLDQCSGWAPGAEMRRPLAAARRRRARRQKHTAVARSLHCSQRAAARSEYRVVRCIRDQASAFVASAAARVRSPSTAADRAGGRCLPCGKARGRASAPAGSTLSHLWCVGAIPPFEQPPPPSSGSQPAARPAQGGSLPPVLQPCHIIPSFLACTASRCSHVGGGEGTERGGGA